MSRSIIAYNKELPEIPDRLAWEKPISYLVKDPTVPDGWRIEDSSRRPSDLLLIKKLRVAIDTWREQGYPGASAVTQRLFAYWFEEDHEVAGFTVPFRYHFCQREAIEALIYIVEIAQLSDAKDLIQAYAHITRHGLFDDDLVYETTMDGDRRLRRYFPERDVHGVQDLPPENLARYAFKLATGSGKTWIIAMAVVWAHFHKKRVPGSNLSTNFLILAPNVIVYQRLEKDFASNKIFYDLPLIPPEWRGSWSQKVILRGESADPDPSGNLFLTNIQQIYANREKEWTPQNAIDALLGRKPVKDLASYQRSMLDRLKDLNDLIVINDEAHHVHDNDLEWNKSLLTINAALPHGLALWLDFSATPKDQNGMYYPWTLCDYPLAQAVEDRIVKAPIIVTREADPNHPPKDPENITKETLIEKCGFWIAAAVQRWQDHTQTYKKLNTKPVLFIMAENSAFADIIGQHLIDTKEFGLKEQEVLVIHTDAKGDITKNDLEKARAAARDIDQPGNKIKAIVSVMMLREGWDVRNVSVVLGLRPFKATSKILPEQVIGRGLRLMVGVTPDRTQSLEVLGTQNLLDLLRDQLEAEGVGVTTVKTEPPRPIIIEAIKEKIAYDIAIPITKPVLTHNVTKLSTLDPLALEAIYDEQDIDDQLRYKLKLEFVTTRTEVHRGDFAGMDPPIAQVLLSTITNKTMQHARLANVFAELYPLVRKYVANRCFGTVVDLDADKIRRFLNDSNLQETIAKYLARKISELMVDKRTLEFEKAGHRLSDTLPFQWRRNLQNGPLVCEHTIFNFVATYNDFERRFAEFLDKVEDVRRFAALGTTEQGNSGSQFRVDYLKPSGAIGFYYPDWVVVQQTDVGDINWIIETKGRVWDGTDAKDAAINDWCQRITEKTGAQWRFRRIDQIDFESKKPKTLAQAVSRGIAFLGWGSLLWDPGDLAVDGPWHADGPLLPIEFARISGDGRLTLVITPGSASLPVSWAFSTKTKLADAIENLREREKITSTRYIGSCTVQAQLTETLPAELVSVIDQWRQAHNLDAVIWTNLSANFENRYGKPLNPENAVAYLQGLEAETQLKAEKYIRCAPTFIQTPIRHAVEQHLGWTVESESSD